MQLSSNKVCPNCHNQNPLGASACVVCGLPLRAGGIVTPGARVPHMSPILSEHLGDAGSRTPQYPVPPRGCALYLPPSGTAFHVCTDPLTTLGRAAGQLPDEAFLDLGAGALVNGVSRRHASIRRLDSGYEILDLGSSNGTRMGGQFLEAHKPYRLVSGSSLWLGRLELVAVFLEPAQVREG